MKRVAVRVSEKTGLPIEITEVAVRATFETISEEILDGPVSVRGFGRFYQAVLKRRKAFNPSKRVWVEVPEKRRVRFRAGAALTRALEG